jgi:hypothetical protein
MRHGTERKKNLSIIKEKLSLMGNRDLSKKIRRENKRV